MRITLSSSALSSRLGTLAKVINSKNSLAILDCFLFEVANNQLTITASDSENVMRTTMPLETSDGEGKFAVNNHTILDAVKELPEQPLTLDVDTNTFSVKIIYQNGIYNFTAQNAEEYPIAQPMPETATSLTMPSNVLGDNAEHCALPSPLILFDVVASRHIQWQRLNTDNLIVLGFQRKNRKHESQ